MDRDSILQINNKLGIVRCQAFDPLMLIKEKAQDLHADLQRLNTSCFAPAYVYVDGSHGSRYLCDFHFALEHSAEYGYNGLEGLDVFSTTIIGLEKIKDTFGDIDSLPMPKPSVNCWCGNEAYVFMGDKGDNDRIASTSCNFHFRKTYYRNLSNGIDLFEIYTILDYRKLMPDQSIEGAIICLPML